MTGAFSRVLTAAVGSNRGITASRRRGCAAGTRPSYVSHGRWRSSSSCGLAPVPRLIQVAGRGTGGGGSRGRVCHKSTTSNRCDYDYSSLTRTRFSGTSSAFPSISYHSSRTRTAAWLRLLSTGNGGNNGDDDGSNEDSSVGKEGGDNGEESDENGDRNHIPRGFQDFFPPSARRKPPPPLESSSAKEDDSSSAHLLSKGDSKEKEGKDRKQEDSQQTPPNDENYDNLPGLLALLAVIIMLRSWLESEESELGQEITFVEFRNKFLTGQSPQQVEVLQIVNKKMARVILKHPGAAGASASMDGSGSGGGAADLPTWKDGDTSIGWEDGAGDVESNMNVSSSPGASAASSRRRQPVYYFYIGSVESLEEKLAQAQQHLHPAQWVEVQYITRTNYALEALKSLPMLAFLAAIYFGSRAAMPGGMGGAGGMGGGRGGGGGMGGIFGIGRSTAKKIKKEDVNVTFADVAGWYAHLTRFSVSNSSTLTLFSLNCFCFIFGA